MKKMLMLMSAAVLALASCSDNNNTPQEEKIENLPAKQQWSRTYDGSDYTIPQYPDLYSHYWEYVWSVKENPNMVLKVHGAFPHCRYFSFSLYNDADGSAINGSSDYEIKPDENSVNPFVETSTKENYYTVYIVPEAVSEAQIEKLGANGNVIKVNSDVDHANIMIRQYLSVDQNGNADEYGGVDMPTIQAYDITTMKEVKTPIGLTSNVFSNVQSYIAQKTDSLNDVPFMLAPHGSFYPNNATDYLYTRTVVNDDQVLTFSFIPAPMPASVEEYKDAKARYWSICVGACMDTRSYYSIHYDQAKVKDGEKVNFVICTKQNPRLAEIEQRVKDENAKGNNTQIIVWDSEIVSKSLNKPLGKAMTILYRNILPNKNWEYSISKITPTPYANAEKTKNYYMLAYEDAEHKIADQVVGEYAPHGKKVTNEQFLNAE